MGHGERGKEITYYKGTIFCSGQNKLNGLEMFFNHLKISFPDIVMVDDKVKNLLAVQNFVEKHGRSFTGYRDGFLDETAKVDVMQANNHLLRIKELLPDNAKHIIKQFNTLPTTKNPNQALQTFSLFSNQKKLDGGWLLTFKTFKSNGGCIGRKLPELFLAHIFNG